MNSASRKMIMTGALTLSFLGLAAVDSALAEDKPEADFSVAAYSQYVWRGFGLSKDSIVIQPSLTVGYKGFGVNLWGNLDTDQDDMTSESFNWNETDLTLSYDGSYEKLGYSIGYIYYDLDGVEDTQELYFGLSLDTLLSPSLTYYTDIANVPGWYATLGISHSIALNETLALDLGAQVGFLDNDAEYSEFHDGNLSAAISFPVNDYLTVTPELYWSFPLSSEAEDVIKAGSPFEDEDSYVYGGVSLSFSF